MKKFFLPVVLFGALVLAGCAPMKATKKENIADSSVILVFPSHDVTQRGIPHVRGEGSGAIFQSEVINRLILKTDYDLRAYKPDSKINHEESLSKADALKAAKEKGADYALVLDLGEFRDAAPMTFRSDFLTLQRGMMINTQSDEIVWSLDQPYLLEKSNLGGYHELLDKMAEYVANSIAK